MSVIGWEETGHILVVKMVESKEPYKAVHQFIKKLLEQKELEEKIRQEQNLT